MTLSDLNVDISYITYGEKNIRDTLIIPALKVAKYYKRSVGFFSTSVFDTILEGVVNLAKKGGKIQIIASPHLSQKDVDSICLGYEARNRVYQSAFLRDFDKALEELEDEKLKIAAQLIASNILDIQIVDMDSEMPEVSNEGDYHDKLGIISDEYGNSIVFVGSPNETINGYKKNYEKVRVFTSWVPALRPYVEDEISEFDTLWNNQNPYIKTYKFKDALLQHVIKAVEYNSKSDKKNNKPIELRDYQREAIDAWVNNNYRGFYVMATGTGKTWTAIFSAIELQKKHNVMVVICAPYKHLVRQWSEDVKKVMPKAQLIMVSGENHGWDQQLTQAIVRQRINPDTKVVVISTITSFNLDRFENTIKKSKQDKLLIVDEAHRFTKRLEQLQQQYKYMLGLSATPFSGKSATKGLELMQFFGGQVYDLPIEVALKRGFLVHYFYHPIFVNSTPDEERRFRTKTTQIMGCFNKNGVCIDPENLALYLRARLRIIAMAQEKIDRIHEIFSKVKERKHFIVYCGDGKLYSDSSEELRHIQFVKRELGNAGYKVSQFTASENMDERMSLVETFNAGEIDALAAIRCLDEGINIPSIEGALILASNDDYREFIQRRGRILRVYENKKYANIYDVIVLPSMDTPKLAEIELRRYLEYARLADNADVLLKELENLTAYYGIEPDTLLMQYDEIEEAPLDD